MGRDGHRCMITGLKDYNRPNGEIIVQAAHIIPQSVNKNIEKGTANVCADVVFLSSINIVVQHHQSGGVWAILAMFTNERIIKDLVGDRVNRPKNIISLNISSHQFFDELRLWLKLVEVCSPSLLPSYVSSYQSLGWTATHVSCVYCQGLSQTQSTPSGTGDFLYRH